MTGWRYFPWSLRGAVFVVGITLMAGLLALVVHPIVSTAEIQRRDRLSAEAQFVDTTYRYFLGRPADTAGLAEYQALYDRDGPRAVALAIVASSEYELKHPSGTAPDNVALADQFLQQYDSGALLPGPTPDWPGRWTFVLLIGLAASGVVVLERLRNRTLSGGALHIYVPHGYVVGLFAALSAMWFLNIQALFYTFGPGSIGYAEWLDRLADLSIARGLAHIWTPYPQATPMLLVVLESIANAAADWLQSDVWTSYTLFRWLFQAVFLLAPAVLLVSVTYRMGMLLSPASATVGAGIVAFSFAPLYYGITSTVVTDPLPVLITTLGVWFLVRKRFGWAGLALGVAAAMKLIPLVLLAPAVVLASSWSARRRVALVPAVVLACVFAPFLLTDADMFWSPFRWQSGRPPWESMYAFVNWLVSAPHEFTQPAFEDLGVGHSFGWVFWGITPPLTALTTPVPASPLRWENAVAAVGVGLSLCAVVAAKSSGPRAIIRWALYALAVTFLWSPGWSPQYELYVIPLAALAFESPLAAFGAVLALEIPTFLEYPLFLPWAYFYGGSAVWLAWAATVARYLVLGWLAMYVLRSEASLSSMIERWSAARRAFAGSRGHVPAVTAGFAAVIATVVALAPVATHAQTTGSGCGSTRVALSATTPTPLGDMDWPIPGGWFFSEAGESAMHGYSVVDDASARMWSEFSRLGGWPVLGFPASQRFNWHGQLAQATQRAILEWSPVTGQVDFANVLDLIHDDGRDADLVRMNQVPPPLDVDEAGLPYETIAANRLAWLDTRPAIKSSYCNAPGGGDPIQLWGLPTSQAVNMSERGGEVYVLRTQRAAFQEWVDGADFAAPGQVTVVLAGDVAKEFNLLPDDAMVPEPAPPH